MELESYFDFLDSDTIRVKGHRIGIERILFLHLEQHLTAEQIVAELPTLTLEEVYATFTYYWHNQAAVDAYIQRLDQIFEERWQEQNRNPSPVRQRLREMAQQREQAAS